MSLATDGFEIHRAVFDQSELVELRQEATRVAEQAGSVCVRHLAERSDRFRAFSRDARLKDLLGDDLEPVRSILFDKTPDENWPVPWHQDLTIAVHEKYDVDGYGTWSVKDGAPHVQPPIAVLETMTTARLHLDDATTSNGALWVVPGSHRSGKLDAGEVRELTSTSAIACECQAGDVLLMSPLILHSSRRSTVAGHRRVLHVEYARLDVLDSRLAWRH